MFGKCSKGSTNTESDATFDLQTQCMKLLEVITPPLPPEQFNKAFDRLLDLSVQKSFMEIFDTCITKWAWNLS